jgi:hypothetical protein
MDATSPPQPTTDDNTTDNTTDNNESLQTPSHDQPPSSSSATTDRTADSSATPNVDDIPSFCVVSYNVRKILSRNGKGSSRPIKIIEAIRQSGADVVCLQETHQAWELLLRMTLSQIYPHMSFHHHASAGGLACLSRFPILSEIIIDMPVHVKGAAYPLWLGSIAVTLGQPPQPSPQPPPPPSSPPRSSTPPTSPNDEQQPEQPPQSAAQAQTIEVWFANVHLRPPLLSRTGYVSVKAYFATPAIRVAELRFLIAHLIGALSRRRARVTDILDHLLDVQDAAGLVVPLDSHTDPAAARAGDFEITNDATPPNTTATSSTTATLEIGSSTDSLPSVDSDGQPPLPPTLACDNLSASNDTEPSVDSTDCNTATSTSQSNVNSNNTELASSSGSLPLSISIDSSTTQQADVDVPIVICGDFSEDDTGTALRWLAGSPDTGKPCERNPLPLRNTLHGLDVTSVTYEWAVAWGFALYGRFDHIYYSIHTLHCIGSWVLPGCSVRSTDHFPLIAHFSLVDRSSSTSTPATIGITTNGDATATTTDSCTPVDATAIASND